MQIGHPSLTMGRASMPLAMLTLVRSYPYPWSSVVCVSACELEIIYLFLPIYIDPPRRLNHHSVSWETGAQFQQSAFGADSHFGQLILQNANQQTSRNESEGYAGHKSKRSAHPKPFQHRSQTVKNNPTLKKNNRNHPNTINKPPPTETVSCQNWKPTIGTTRLINAP